MKIVDNAVPLFRKLDRDGIDYCVIGGLGVIINGLVRSYDYFRETRDIDIMLPGDYSNIEFSKAYLAAYAQDPELGKNVYEAVFGDEGFDELSKEDQAFVNTSFIGAQLQYDGIDTPSVDAVRSLDEETIETLDYDIIRIKGVNVPVATPECLAKMKEYTVKVLEQTYRSFPRPQDLVDLSRLNDIITRDRTGGAR